MIQLKEIHSSDTELYAYSEHLLMATFPANEYRPLPELRDNTDRQENFHLDILLNDETLIGLIAHWEFEKFRYIEYFAIDASLRNNGYGSQVLKQFCSRSSKPVVLEIELPDTDEAIRRKDFYERNHFVAWPNEYFQPPFRKGDNCLPVMICCYGELSPAVDFDNVKQTLHTEVYHYTLG